MLNNKIMPHVLHLVSGDLEAKAFAVGNVFMTISSHSLFNKWESIQKWSFKNLDSRSNGIWFFLLQQVNLKGES